MTIKNSQPRGERRPDAEHGGLFYFRDLKDWPVQEYWHDMKFWWPHCDTIIATLLAWTLTGDEKYAKWHRDVIEGQYVEGAFSFASYALVLLETP
jgi:N-acylglucosamine 2-epimerase